MVTFPISGLDTYVRLKRRAQQVLGMRLKVRSRGHCLKIAHQPSLARSAVTFGGDPLVRAGQRLLEWAGEPAVIESSWV